MGTGCLVTYADWSNGDRGEWGSLGWGGGGGGRVARQLQKCNVLGYWHQEVLIWQTDHASPCVRDHRVDYATQAVF